MPEWRQVLTEIQDCSLEQVNPLDYIRQQYLNAFSKETHRNVIAYYSGWLQKEDYEGVAMNDNDVNGLTAVIHNIDPSIGLDIILHTPGGDMAATESIVKYLHSVFHKDIRAIIPQLAMSAGTMMACACNEIIMGKESSLGPIDPQMGGVPASGVIREFERAKNEIAQDPSTALVWQAIITKYHPTFVGECENALEWASQMVQDWLRDNMFSGHKENERLSQEASDGLSDHDEHKHHNRHINIEGAKELKLNVTPIEDFGGKFQDLILTIHRLYMYTFSTTSALKIIENHKGNVMVHRVVRPDLGLTESSEFT